MAECLAPSAPPKINKMNRRADYGQACNRCKMSEIFTRHCAKLVHEGDYVAEVEVDLILSDEGWSPYLSLEDAYKLDDVREALRRGDVKSAAELARVYTLTPVAI